MTKSLPCALALGWLALTGAAAAQAPPEPSEEPKEEQQPVVRRLPLYYQSYYRPGGPWSSAYRGLGYYVLDDNGLPVGRHELEARGPFFGPHWISGFGVGWEPPPAWGDGWTGWSAGWDSWGAPWGAWGDAWDGQGQRPRGLDRRPERERRESAPRPDPRRE